MTSAKKPPRGKTVKLSKPPANTEKAARTPAAKKKPAAKKTTTARKSTASKKTTPTQRATTAKKATATAKKGPAKKRTAAKKPAASPKRTTGTIDTSKMLVENPLSPEQEAKLPKGFREDGALKRGYVTRYRAEDGGATFINTVVACSKACFTAVTEALVDDLGYDEADLRHGRIDLYRSECSMHTLDPSVLPAEGEE